VLLFITHVFQIQVVSFISLEETTTEDVETILLFGRITGSCQSILDKKPGKIEASASWECFVC
jgi:hypothetical protein